MTENEIHHAKEELLENISDLFLKYGLRSTSMEDICSHLKISKKTLYQFFANKDDVVEQVMLHRRNNHRTQKDMEKLKSLDAVRMMLSIARHIIDDLKSRKPSNLFDLKKYHPEVYERVNDRDHVFIHNLLNEIIDKGIRENLFRPDINREIQIYLFIKQMALLGEPEIITDMIYPMDTIISTIVGNFIRSLSTPQGIKELENVGEKI